MKKVMSAFLLTLTLTALIGAPVSSKEAPEDTDKHPCHLTEKALLMPDPAVEFAKAITRNDFREAQKYIADFVKIPEIQEYHRMQSYQLIPSPQPGVQILLVHLHDENKKRERLAFIWELAVNYGCINQIRALYEGPNPSVDEARIIREYQYRFKRHVLTPTELPFKNVTEFRGYIDDDSSLELIYRSDDINGFFRVKAAPATVDLSKFKFDNSDIYYTLKDGTKALYRSNYKLAYELRFQKNGLQYALAIGNKKFLKVKYKAETLIQIANSMV